MTSKGPNKRSRAPREMVAEDIMLPAPGPCAACGGYEQLKPESWGKGGLNDVCLPCFYIWHDGIDCCQRPECYGQMPHKHPEDIGIYSRQMKAEGKWPWNRP